MQVKWPNGKRCAVTLTFDFDAETIWLAQDATNIHRPGTVSQGTYGAKVGMPKILEALKDEDVPATFFVPGWVADNRTASVEAILKGGHEIGHHSYWHRWMDPRKPEVEEEDLDRTIESLKRVTGSAPLGYRAPFGEIGANMIRLLQARGFTYDSSLQDDIVPYWHAGSGAPLVELPWHRSIADAPYILPTAAAPRPILTNEHILTIWKAEFDAAYASAGFFDILMHPEAIGRPSRIPLMVEFIRYVKSHDSVWIATCIDVANAWSKNRPVSAQAYTPFLQETPEGEIGQI